MMTPAQFRKIVWAHYKKHGRHDLPWRKTRNVYHILVSEVMLQQTQVDRVIPFYKNFIKQFPTAKKLADAPLSDVLKVWQGLGYNRRAKMLRGAAEQLVDMPLSKRRLNLVPELEKLPGVGPYTASAIVAFAHNEEVVVIETNIRTVIIHHFFPNKKKVSDKEIEKILRQVLPKGRSREWYSALMDYGAHLKCFGISYNSRMIRYAKQSKFSGSLREARGAILREFTRGVTSRAHLLELLGQKRRAQMKQALEALLAEGFISESLLS